MLGIHFPFWDINQKYLCTLGNLEYTYTYPIHIPRVGCIPRKDLRRPKVVRLVDLYMQCKQDTKARATEHRHAKS